MQACSTDVEERNTVDPRDEAHALTVSRPELLVGGDDAEFRHLVHDLLAFAMRLEAVRSKFGAFLGLTGIQYTILISVRQLQGAEGVGVKEIADHLGLSGAFVTIEVGKLITRGLLHKRPNARDRRRVQLRVTKEGETALASLAPMQAEINDAIFASLDEEAFRDLRKRARELRSGSDRALAMADGLLAPKGDTA